MDRIQDVQVDNLFLSMMIPGKLVLKGGLDCWTSPDDWDS